MKILNLFLYYFRYHIFRNYREDIIIKNIKKEINILRKNDLNKKIYNILDIGSGMQPYVIKNLVEKLNLDKEFKFTADCYDFYNEEKLNQLNLFKDLNFFHINELNYKKKYDFVIIIDVLHHIGLENLKEIKYLLSNLSLVGQYLIIKDHFETNYLSRVLLIIMDFIGNFYNNVKIPKKYFKENTFNQLIIELNLIEIKRITDVYYYKKIWLLFRNPKLQFISIIKSKDEK